MTTVHKKVDVVTVGAGWTSNILGWKLTEAGYNVVALEQGPDRRAYPDFAHNHDSLLYSVRKRLMAPIESETWTWRPHERVPALPMRQFGGYHPGQGVGGSAIHWSGMLLRFLPSDFKLRTHIVEKYGEEKLPENSTIQDWPITYEELEPYYNQFEWDIGSSGLPYVDEPSGGNPFEPRNMPYPNPPLERNIPSLMFAEASQSLGYSPFPLPSGILSRAYTDRFGQTRSGCLYCGFCTRFGCEVDAKSTGMNTVMPLALKTGRYEIRTQTHVTRVDIGPDGLATGLVYIDMLTGEEHFQPAEIVVLSGYTLTNVKLLLVSRNSVHPNGLGNDRGQVGRNFTHQMWYAAVTGQFPGRRFNLYMGNTSTISAIYDFYGMEFDHSNLDFIGGAGIYSTIGEREPVTSAGGLPIGSDEDSEFVTDSGGEKPRNWGREWKEALRNYWDNHVPIAIQGDSFAYRDYVFDLDPNYVDAYGMPLLRFTFDWTDDDRRRYRFLAEKCVEVMQQMGAEQIVWVPELPDYNITSYKSTHITGGAITGSSPANSVTNKYGQVWDTPNLFVTGAALFPQNPGANPSDTLCALAYMTGDALVERYFKDPNRLLG
jgi:gluconate 2-dehydrogenase alpha chain